MGIQQETKNKILFKNIVEEAFELDKESLKLFKHLLFFERDIAPEYKKIIKDAPDLRARFNLNDLGEEDLFNLLEEKDNGYEIFKNVFFDFKEHYGITYREYFKNKKQVEGNEVKLSKLINNFYTDKLHNLLSDLNVFLRVHTDSRHKIFKYLNNKFSLKEDINSSIYRCKMGYAIQSNEITMNFALDGVDYIKEIEEKRNLTEEDRKELVSFITQLVNEEIGKYKPSKDKKLQLVFSLNPVDWFLCSTGNNWSSCLNLENEGEVFWQGLPQLIGDKNRAMVYLTDGTQKEYMGIEVDKVITRSWVLLLRTKEDNITHFHFVREYPGNKGLKGLCEKFIGKRFLTRDDLVDYFGYTGKKIVGRYYVEILTHHIHYDKKAYSTIYMDSTRVKLAKKNKAKYLYGKYGYYKMGSGNSNVFFRRNMDIEHYYFRDDMPSLSEIIDIGDTILDYIEDEENRNYDDEDY